VTIDLSKSALAETMTTAHIPSGNGTGAIKVSMSLPRTERYNSILIHSQLWIKALRDSVNHQYMEGENCLASNQTIRECYLYPYASFDSNVHKMAHREQTIFVFHNVTPASMLFPHNPLVAVRALLADVQLRTLPKELPWIAVSEFNRDCLRKRGFRNVEVVPLVVDEDPGGPKVDDPILLFVGRITPSKNLLKLLDTYVAVRERFRARCQLLIVGSGKTHCAYTSAFRRKLEQVRERFEVSWLQAGISHSDLRTLHRSATLYVSMSRHEGFGVPVLESISCGTPALYTECGGTESVLHGVGCVSAGDIDQFVSRTIQLLADIEERKQLLAEQAKLLFPLRRKTVATRLCSAIQNLMQSQTRTSFQMRVNACQ
jgi:glycosyltransferase involved in cell wall biosynthesis